MPGSLSCCTRWTAPFWPPSRRKKSRVTLRQLRRALPVCRTGLVTYDFQAQRVTWLALDTASQTQLSVGRTVPLSAYRIPPGHSQGDIGQIADLGQLDHRTGVEEVLWGEGIRRSLSLPLLVGGQLIGSLNCGVRRRASLAPKK